MVSKNNRVKRMEEAAERQSHFSIRKLTIGAASVLLGTTLWMGTHADIAKAADNDANDNGAHAEQASDNQMPEINSNTQVVAEVTNSDENTDIKSQADAQLQKQDDSTSEAKVQAPVTKNVEKSAATQTVPSDSVKNNSAAKAETKTTTPSANTDIQKKATITVEKKAESASKDLTKANDNSVASTTKSVDLDKLDLSEAGLKGQLATDKTLSASQILALQDAIAQKNAAGVSVDNQKMSDDQAKKLFGASLVKANAKDDQTEDQLTKVTSWNDITSAYNSGAKGVDVDGNIYANSSLNIVSGSNFIISSSNNGSLNLNGNEINNAGALTLKNITVNGSVMGNGTVNVEGNVTSNVNDSNGYNMTNSEKSQKDTNWNQTKGYNIQASNVNVEDNASLTINRSSIGDGIHLPMSNGSVNVGNYAKLTINMNTNNNLSDQARYHDAGIFAYQGGTFKSGLDAVVTMNTSIGQAIAIGAGRPYTTDDNRFGGYGEDNNTRQNGISQVLLGKNSKFNFSGRDGVILGNNSTFNSGEYSIVRFNNNGRGVALDLGNDSNIIIAKHSDTQFKSVGKNHIDAKGHTVGPSGGYSGYNYIGVNENGNITVDDYATFRVILTERNNGGGAGDEWDDVVQLDTRNSNGHAAFTANKGSIVDIRDDNSNYYAELISFPRTPAGADINININNPMYINLSRYSDNPVGKSTGWMATPLSGTNISKTNPYTGNLIYMGLGGSGHFRIDGGVDKNGNPNKYVVYQQNKQDGTQTIWLNIEGVNYPISGFGNTNHGGSDNGSNPDISISGEDLRAGVRANDIKDGTANSVDGHYGISSQRASHQIWIPHQSTTSVSGSHRNVIRYEYEDGTPVLDENGNPLVKTQEINLDRELTLDLNQDSIKDIENYAQSHNADEVLDYIKNTYRVTKDSGWTYTDENGNTVTKPYATVDSPVEAGYTATIKSTNAPGVKVGADGSSVTAEFKMPDTDAVVQNGQLTDAYKKNGTTGIPGDYETVVVYSKEEAKKTTPYQTKITYDSNLQPGQVELVQQGVNGVQYIKDDGSIDTAKSTDAKDEIIHIGPQTATVDYYYQGGDAINDATPIIINGKPLTASISGIPVKTDDSGNIVFDKNGNLSAATIEYNDTSDIIKGRQAVSQLTGLAIQHVVVNENKWQDAVNAGTNKYKLGTVTSRDDIIEAAEKAGLNNAINLLPVEGPTFRVTIGCDEWLTKSGNLTVNYIDQDTGKAITDPDTSLSMSLQYILNYRGVAYHGLPNVFNNNKKINLGYGQWNADNGNFTYGYVDLPDFSSQGYQLVSVDPSYAHNGNQVGGVTATFDGDYNATINVYYKKAQADASIEYIDDTENKTLTTDTETGKIGDPIDYSTTSKINNYEKQGYVLVSDGFTNALDKTFKQGGSTYQVHLKHGVVPVTPTTPPTDVPKTPDGKRLVDPSQLTKDVNLTVTYKNSDGTAFTAQTPSNAAQKITFTGNTYVDSVTGQIVNAKQENGQWVVDTDNTATPQITWTPENGSFTAVTSPTENGYHVTNVSAHADGNNVAVINGVTRESQDIDIIVTYAPNGTEVRNAHDLPASQTTKFVDENGNELADSVVQKSSFHYSGDTYDTSTGDKIKDGSWNPESHTFNSVDAPVIQGYVAESRTAAGMTATVDNPNVQNEVVYHKIGKIIPVDNITKEPIPGADQPQYQNDQNDPTKVVPNENIPEVDNYLPVNPGQQVTPEDPTKDTEVPYKQVIHGTIKYIDDTTKGTLKTDKFQGFIGDQIDYATAGIIKGYEDSGYKLVSNNFKDGNETYARTGNDFEVHLVHTYSPVTPKTPHGLDPKELTKDVKETIHYIGAGDKTPKDNVQTSQWTRQFTWDNVDKKIVTNGELDRDWAITPGQKTNYDEVKSPVVEGYHPDKETVSSTPVTQTDIDVTVTYAPNGQEVRDTKDVPATQTTKFVDENGKELADSVVQNSNFHYSGDTYDKFTGKKIKDGSWNEESHTFNSVNAPVINGYVAESKTADGLTATIDNPNVTNQIVYHKIGKIVPVDPDHNPIPDAPTPDYQNDPTDPTKVTPNEPTPNVPGWTTTTTDVTPTDPTKDTQVVYKQAANGTIKYIDDTAKTTLDSENLPSGYVGDKINYTTAGKIADYEKQGYKLVSNDFKDGNETYAKTGNDFEVHFVHNYVPVTPKTPHGVDPSLVQKDVKETVKYVGAGDKTPKDVVQTSQWTRTLTMDQVTGQIVPNGKLDTDWAIAPGEKTSYDEVKTPDIEGYHADKATIPATKVTQQDITEIVTYAPNGTEVRNNRDIPASQTTKFVDDNGNEIADSVVQTSNFHYSGDTYDTVTGKETAQGSWNEESHKFNSVNAPVIIGYVAEAKTADGLTATIDNPNVTNQIVYHKIGKIIPVDPNHDPIPDAPTPDYQNDPKDPTKVVPNEPTPDVPNYTTTTKTVTPTDPTKNTQVVYNQVVEGTVTYYDDTTNQVLGNVDTIKGYVGDKINYSTQGRIDNYESKGYKLVSDGFTTSDQLFKKSHNYFEVHFVHTYSPVNPKNPNPKVAPSDYTKSYTSTVHYTGAPNVPADNVQTSTWTRTLTIDNVTGNIIPGGQYDTDWAPDKKSYDAVPTPNVPDYQPDKTEVPAKTTEQKDLYETVNYSPVAKDQKAVVNYIDLDNHNAQIATSGELTGKAGDVINYSTADQIKAFENQGYVLANDGFPAGAAFDNVDGNTQTFEVTFHHGQIPVNPKNPHDVDKNLLEKDVKETVHYVGAGNATPSDNVQTSKWGRTLTYDQVTKQLVPNGKYDTDWAIEPGQKTAYDQVNTPVVNGFHADQRNVPVTAVTQDDITKTVNYSPNGKIIPVDPNHNPIPGVDQPQYPTNPSDPTTVTPNEPVPTIPGYTPSVPTVTPTDPGKDTEVIYTKNPEAVQGKVTYIDDTTKSTLDSDPLNGNVGDKINYTTADKITNYEDQGYVLVSNDFHDGNETFAESGNNFEVHLKHGTKEVNPKNPDPKHGYTPDNLTKTGTQTVHYIVAGGGVAAPADQKQNITLEHDLIIDTVNGDIVTDNGWTMTTPNFEAVVSPTIDGYTASDFFAGGQPYEFDKATGNAVNGSQLNPYYTVVYTKNPTIPTKTSAAGKVTYIDDTENSTMKTDGLNGFVGDKINYTTADQIKNYETQGYKLVSNNFRDGEEVFTNGSNAFEVHFVHTYTPVNPKNPHDGVNPDQVEKEVKETVHYVGAPNVPADNVQTSKWGRTVTYDNVTKQVVPNGQYDTDWAIEPGQKTIYDQVDTPVINGYHADQRNVPATSVTQDDITKTVNYSPNGKIIPVDPNHNPIPGVDQPQYPTNPSDPTTVTPNEPVPSIPGYTPSVPTVTPTDPGKDTEVIYTPIPVAKDQNAIVNYVDSDEDNKQIASSGNLTGMPNTTINYSTAETINGLEKKGYVLVYDGFPAGATFDNDDRTTQTYTVVMKHGHTTVTPKNPGKPGEPVNPDNPDGPKYPNGTDINNLLRKGTQTIHYTGAGASTPQDNVESFDFTRNITFDNVTGKIIDGGTWNVSSHKFDTVTTPVVDGYHADQIMAGGQTVTPDDLTKTITVNYSPNGKIIPVDPSGKPIPNAPTPQYPTDPKDPTDVTPDEPTPSVPGYTTTTKTVTPQDPGKDTEVVYVPVVNDQNATIRYIDQDNNNSVIKSDNVSGKPGTSINYSTAATIENLQNQGYELVSDGFTGKNAKFDNDDKTTQTFDVVLKHGHTTITPNNPGKPGEPINPNDPDGPKWPNGTDSSSLIKTGTQRVHYQGAGNATPDDNVTTVEFDHSITFDNVTGKQISDNGWTPASQTYNTVVTPNVPGYTANVQVVGGDTVHAGDPNLDRTYTVTYTKNQPDQPDTPQPTTPAPVNPETPDNPTNPTPETPNQPETVTPNGEDVPDEPEDTPEETVKPHAANVPTPAVHKRVNAPVHAAKVATVKNEAQPQLPQTGDDEEADLLATIAGGAAVTMSMIGLAGVKRRKH